MTEEIDIDDIGSDETDDKGSPLKMLAISGAVALLLGGAAAGVAFLYPTGPRECIADANAGGHGKKLTKSIEEAEFVNLEPLVVTLGPNAISDYLKISLSLETSHDHVKTLEHLQPKLRDVLNTYLRAVDENDLVEPAAMTRLRAQMLRRLQVVASSEAINDVLITDFVLN